MCKNASKNPKAKYLTNIFTIHDSQVVRKTTSQKLQDHKMESSPIEEELVSTSANSTQYSLNMTNFSRSRASLKPNNSSRPEYLCDFSYITSDIRASGKKYSVVLHSSIPNADSKSSIIGISAFDMLSLSSPIHLCFGDPDIPLEYEERGTEESSQFGPAVWETMHSRSPIKLNIYELTIDLGPSIGRKTFHWKRTHTVGQKGLKKLDFLNLKMEDVETGRVVATFVHYPWVGWKRGYFEIVEDEGIVKGYGDGEKWREVVLLSGLATLEYMRKASGWSW